jgi:hypothetical protein
VYAGYDFVRPLQVKSEKLPARLRIKHQLFRCLCRSTEYGRKPPRSEGLASRDQTPAPGHAQKTPRKDKGFAGLVALGYAEAHDGMSHSICRILGDADARPATGKNAAIKVLFILGSRDG